MSLGWFSWFGMSFIDPYAISLSSWARYTGLAMFIIGVSLFIIAFLKVRDSDSDTLVTSGIYSRLRHPMYLGFIIWIIGFPVFTESLFTLASVAIWIPHILYWRMSEERQLTKMYEDYEEYKKKTLF
jgi:protein-S-isoprenylcysteine O-methyltransferase Ste14